MYIAWGGATLFQIKPVTRSSLNLFVVIFCTVSSFQNSTTELSLYIRTCLVYSLHRSHRLDIHVQKNERTNRDKHHILRSSNYPYAWSSNRSSTCTPYVNKKPVLPPTAVVLHASERERHERHSPGTIEDNSIPIHHAPHTCTRQGVCRSRQNFTGTCETSIINR